MSVLHNVNSHLINRSFALKDQEPEKFDEIVNNLEELFLVRGGPMSSHINQAEKMAIDCIDDDNDIGLLQAILRLYEQNQYDQLVDLANGNGAEPYAVVLHGDLWSNNWHVVTTFSMHFQKD